MGRHFAAFYGTDGGLKYVNPQAVVLVEDYPDDGSAGIRVIGDESSWCVQCSAEEVVAALEDAWDGSQSFFGCDECAEYEGCALLHEEAGDE